MSLLETVSAEMGSFLRRSLMGPGIFARIWESAPRLRFPRLFHSKCVRQQSCHLHRFRHYLRRCRRQRRAREL